MRLFIKDHLPLVVFNLIQLIVVLMVFWFDGYDDGLTAFYALFLGTFLLLGFILYRYFTIRSYYESLSHPSVDPPEARPKTIAAVPAALQHLLVVQFQHYQGKLRVWERKQQEHQTFMNHWVHQMKTPLSVIELIVQNTDDSEVESIAEEADRLRQGLDMVLYMARLETFAQDFHVEQVELRKLAHEVIQENKRSFIRNYVYPVIEIDERHKVESDAKWLRFLLQQVLSNAIKYSAGTRTQIKIGAYEHGNDIVLTVQDHGAGIPKTDLSRVFQPFFTGENGRRYKESTGMGLYLVRTIAEKMHHEVTIESVVGEGTTVYVTFHNTMQANA
ncbi:sensor histidine kinase [Paenibacillus sp. 1001270B_150601_E10]|uniref:sensor histidine kinase n=1 Tax=Paenibacillus sp. 1001270B_150601_E10 TaxID=2787079 RepID=UPI00189DBF66|nr:sensor histidine kinase [Paenibacillus sp. 1001270B_150601_E10]